MKKKIFLFFFIFHIPALFCQADTILLIASKNLPYTRDVLYGITFNLSETSPNTDTETIYIEDTDPLETIKKQNYKAICVIGNAAAKTVQSIDNTPIIFTMLLETSLADSLPAKSNATGVFMSKNLDAQIDIFKKIAPELGNIYTFYGKYTSGTIDEIKTDDLRSLIKAQKINRPEEIPSRLNGLTLKKNDGFLILADPSIYNNDSIQFIINYCLNHSIPVMGFAPNIAKAGSLIGFTYDYKDIGRQTSQIIVKILNGSQPKDIAAEYSQKTGYILNLKTAKLIGKDIPSASAKEALEVIE